MFLNGAGDALSLESKAIGDCCISPHSTPYSFAFDVFLVLSSFVRAFSLELGEPEVAVVMVKGDEVRVILVGRLDSM